VNRLAGETSPYLRQHRDNPVDWYPWGEEAFAKARADDKPILLSIGYSACHWCHVMAHESFEDEATARVLNDLFVNVKVDREERPDVDAIYMDATQAMTGSGGWPMTVFMAPDGRPFYCGTYFPNEPRHGMPSFVEICRAVDDAWRNRRDELLTQANQLTESIGRSAMLSAPGGAVVPGTAALTAAYRQLLDQHDDQWGGFGRAPKFPQTMSLELLLRAHHRNNSEQTLGVVQTSLDAMAAGGIYDHLGGGFARYSVDAIWLVPHFEKMLYDQALIARVYLHAWQVTSSPAYRQVLDETIEYVLRDLRDGAGGFYAAEDADSEGVEGKFYVWTPDELRAAVGDDTLAEAATAWYGVTEDGNFEGTTILNRIGHRGDLLRPPDVEEARRRLFEARALRVRPGLDDKVLAEWNGLMLATLAEAAAVTGNERWLDEARRAGGFLLEHLRRADGRWLRSWQAERGAGRTLAFAADHGALIDGFTRLAEATGESRWIVAAVDTAEALLGLFWDDEDDGVFTTGHDAEQLVRRPKDLLDNATPSASSLAAVGLLRLGALTGVDRYTQRAEAIVRPLGAIAVQHPTAFGHLLAAVDLVDAGITEIAVVGERDDLVRAVHERYLPTAVLAWGQPYESPLWHERKDGFAYVCRHYACQAPADSVSTLLGQLEKAPM
jgi:uncharacterized protein YyaL (SSP411 family)